MKLRIYGFSGDELKRINPLKLYLYAKILRLIEIDDMLNQLYVLTIANATSKDRFESLYTQLLREQDEVYEHYLYGNSGYLSYLEEVNKEYEEFKNRLRRMK